MLQACLNPEAQMMSPESGFSSTLISVSINMASFSSSVMAIWHSSSTRVIFCKDQSDSKVCALPQHTQKISGCIFLAQISSHVPPRQIMQARKNTPLCRLGHPLHPNKHGIRIGVGIASWTKIIAIPGIMLVLGRICQL